MSTMTTAPSTIMPMAIAKPPRDIRLADSPVTFINRKATSTATGKEAMTTIALRIFPRNRKRIRITSIAPISKAFLTAYLHNLFTFWNDKLLIGSLIDLNVAQKSIYTHLMFIFATRQTTFLIQRF